MHLSRPLLILAVAGLATAAPAGAQSPSPAPVIPAPTSTPPPATTPTPVPPVPAAAPAPARGKLRVSLKAPQRIKGKALALRGDKARVKGSLRPAVAGQRVRIQLTHGSETLKTKQVRVRPDGRFATKLRLSSSGHLVVHAKHKGTRAIKRTRAKPQRVRAFAPTMGYGSQGRLVKLFQRELSRMKYPSPRNGTYDAATGRAVLAYRKVNSLPRTYTPGASVVRRVLAGRGAYKARHPKLGHHVEADISRQFIALVDGRKVVRVYPTSSGKPSTPTILGTFRFYRKDLGTNSLGMVDAAYFIRGYAIHGYHDVPTYNASHGCLRIPIPNARAVYDWVDLGDRMVVEP